MVPLDPNELLELAIDSVGGEPDGDFGQPDWKSTFAELVATVDAAPMNTLGRLMTRQELIRCIRTRLLLTRRWDQVPSPGDEQIVAPVVITGPARSGTTILFELLSLDPTLYAPPTWEVLHPLLAPDLDHDDRPAFGQCESELWTDIQPELAALHEWRADLPAECITLTAPKLRFTALGHDLRWRHAVGPGRELWVPQASAPDDAIRSAGSELVAQDTCTPHDHRPALRHLSRCLGCPDAP